MLNPAFGRDFALFLMQRFIALFIIIFCHNKCVFLPHSLGSREGNILQTPSVLPFKIKPISGVPPSSVGGIFLHSFFFLVIMLIVYFYHLLYY